MTVASALLLQARASSGLSARALASAAGTAQPRVTEIERATSDPRVETLDRLLRATGHQLIVLPSRAPTAAATAIAIRAHLSDQTSDPEDRAFRSLLVLSDGLADAEPTIRAALAAAAAPFTEARRFDAAIAGIVEHHLTAGGIPVPGWVHEPARALPEPWIPDPYASDTIADETPPALRRHGVLLAANELLSI